MYHAGYARGVRHLPLAVLLACNDYELAPSKERPDGELSCTDDDAPAVTAVAIDDTCARDPVVGAFNPVVEWQWAENPVYPGYDDLMATPAVGNLTDDDGDGIVDAHDVPDVVFTSFAGGAYTSAGTITAISGTDGTTHWSVAPGVYSSAGVALGDLDGDGVPEVCTAGTGAAVVCLDNLGNVKWQAGNEMSYVGSPALADLDGDGLAEVILGRQVFNHDGTTRWVGQGGVGYSMSYAVDIDGDDGLEVVAGNTVYDTNGAVLWTAPTGDGMTAVGDFDGDGRADVVVVYGGVVSLVRDAGVVWSTAVPGGGGGPPTVADFDDDGAPEIGIAGAYYYSVIETDGSVRWSMPVQDYSSSVTGSSVFDFEGDGASEVVYADEVTLWVYDGATGAVELALDGHASGTLYEYPLIVDVDNDGSSEIVLASNNYTFSGYNGITVIGDAASSWVASRPTWNQFAYHITNIDDDLSIPVSQEKNWLSWNNFRAGGTLEGPSDWLPNLVPGDVGVCLDECGGDVMVWPTVANAGQVAAERVLLELIGDSGVVIASVTVDRVEPGAVAYGDAVVLTEREWGAAPIRVRVDGADAVEECDEDDNMGNVGKWPCP